LKLKKQQQIMMHFLLFDIYFTVYDYKREPAGRYIQETELCSSYMLSLDPIVGDEVTIITTIYYSY
jgi:hypothetical protein